MKFEIAQELFVNGVDSGLFLYELKQTSFGSLVTGITLKSGFVYINSTEDLVSHTVDIQSIVGLHNPQDISEFSVTIRNLQSSLDYQKDRMILKLQLESGEVIYDDLTDSEKALVVKNCLLDDVTCVTFYMNQGLSLELAQLTHLKNRAIEIRKTAESCENRANSPILVYIAIKYLSEFDAMSFLDALREYLADYKLLAHLGIDYGHSREGIMDYIEATHAYTNEGLSTFNFREGMEYAQCKDELKQFLVYGNEPSEFNVLSS